MSKSDSISDILFILKESGQSALLSGIHGIGKSDRVKNFAEKQNMYFKKLMLAHQEVGDLIGRSESEVLNGEKVTTWSKPKWLKLMWDEYNRGKQCLLCLDEFNRGPLEVRQASLELVLNGTIHEHQIPPNTFIVAAINPLDDEDISYQVEELDPALLDRFFLIKLEPNIEDFLLWCSDKNVHPSIVNYLTEKPDRLHCIGENSHTSPRSWIMLSKAIFSAEEYKPNLVSTLCKIKLGDVLGAEFYYYYSQADKVISKRDVIAATINISYNDIEKGTSVLKDMFKKSNNMLVQEVILNLMSYIDENNRNEDIEKAIVFALHALEPEQLAAVLKSFKLKNIKSFNFFNFSVLDKYNLISNLMMN